MLLLAQAAGEQWWDTLPAQLVMWASAVAAILYLLKKFFGGAEFTRRLAFALLSLGEVEKWPNGSTTLPGALDTIYQRQGDTHNLVKDLKAEFEDHIVDFDVHISSHDRG